MNKGMTRTALRRWGLYCWTLLKWTVDAAAIGVVCGVIGTLFHFGVHEVTAFRGRTHGCCIACLRWDWSLWAFIS